MIFIFMCSIFAFCKARQGVIQKLHGQDEKKMLRVKNVQECHLTVIGTPYEGTLYQ